MRKLTILALTIGLAACGAAETVETIPDPTTTTISQASTLALENAAERAHARRVDYMLDMMGAVAHLQQLEEAEEARQQAIAEQEAELEQHEEAEYIENSEPDIVYTGTGECGGDLPPCWVMEKESGGNYNAVNWGGCDGNNCYGKWQFSGEWACKLGLPCDLLQATPEQQDNAARLLWDGGDGCSNWAAC